MHTCQQGTWKRLCAVLWCADAAAVGGARAVGCCTCCGLLGHGGEGGDLPVLFFVDLQLLEGAPREMTRSATGRHTTGKAQGKGG